MESLQKYFSGGIIYVPKMTKKASWGELSGTREEIKMRNNKIKDLFKNGVRINSLSTTFFLSEETIKKIVYSKKTQK